MNLYKILGNGTKYQFLQFCAASEEDYYDRLSLFSLDKYPQEFWDVSETISELKGGVSGFDKMLDQCDELEYLYKCRNVAEDLLDK